MSSSNRYSSVKRQDSDFYVTPVEPVKLFLKKWSALFDSGKFPFKRILDPCAGGVSGRVPMSYPAAICQSLSVFPKLSKIVTLDIRDDSPADIVCDYFSTRRLLGFDLIISNPPFYLAQPFIEKALNDVADGGYVVFLLRIAYFGSLERQSFWKKAMPVYTFVHSNRMSFLRGKTDSVEYMHCVWQKDNHPEYTKLFII